MNYYFTVTKYSNIIQNIFSSFSVSVHIVASADVGFLDVASSRQNIVLPVWRRKASTTKMIVGLFNLFKYSIAFDKHKTFG